MGGKQELHALVCILSLVILASCIRAASCEVEPSKSLSYISSLPEDYAFTCSSPLMLDNFGTYPCLEAIDRFCIESMVNDTYGIRAGLGADEMELFHNSLTALDNSTQYIVQAQLNRNSMFFALSSIIRSECNYTTDILIFQTLVAFFKPIQLAVPACAINENFYRENAQVTMNSARSALEGSNKGINQAMRVLQDEADELYCMGAGDENYTGPERAVYREVEDIIIDSGSDADVSMNHPSLSKKWAALQKNAVNMHDRFYTTDQTCTASAIINSSLGADGTFPKLMDLHRRIRVAQQSLNETYKSKIVSVQQDINDMNGRINNALAENYNLIRPEEINLFLSNWSQGFEEFPDPASALRHISDAVSGTNDSARSLYLDGTQFHRGQRFYMTNALERFRKAEGRLEFAGSNLALLEQRIAEILDSAESKTAGMRQESRSAIDRFKLGTGTAELYSAADSRWNSAESLYNGLRSKSRGEQLHDYYLAYKGFESAHDTVTNPSARGPYQDAVNTCNMLGGAINLAETDNIDIRGAELNLAAARSRMNRTLEMDNDTEKLMILYDARDICMNESELLHSTAAAKYTYIFEKRRGARDALAVMRSIGKPDYENEAKISGYERYFLITGFSDSALGHYIETDTTYDSVLASLNKQKPVYFAEYFRIHTSVGKAIIPSTIYADQEAEVIIPIEIRNTLGTGCNESFSYQISGIGLGPEDIVSVSDPVIDVTGYGSGQNAGLNIFFRNASANTSYTITVVKKEVVVSSSVQGWTTTSLDSSMLVERRAFTLTTTRDAGSAAFITTYTKDASSCEAFLAGEQGVASINNRTITTALGNVRKGVSSGYVECYVPNPFTVTQTNFTLSNDSVTYYASVRSNVGTLENVWLYFTVSAPVNGETVRVYDPTGSLAGESSYTRYGNDYLVRWKIPSLSGNNTMYRVVFQVSDAYAYATKRRGEVAAKADAHRVNISQRLDKADAEIRTVQYTDALNTLSAAESIVDDFIASEARTSVLSRQASLLSDLMKAIVSNSSILNGAGLSEIAVEIDMKKNDFDSKMQQFRTELNRGNFASAEKLLREMETLADLKTVDTLLYRKEKDIFEGLNGLKTNLLLLGRIKDMSPYIDELKEQESKIPALGDAIKSKDYSSYSSLLSSITDTISRISGIEQAEREGLTELLDARLGEIKNLNSSWKDLRPKMLRIIDVESSNPNKVSNISSISSIESSVNEMDAMMAGLSSRYSSLKGLDTSEIVNNIDGINSLPSEIGAANKTQQYLLALNAQYKKEAEMSFSLGRDSLEEALRDVSEEDKPTATQLSSYLSKAKSSYDSGQYLNSMLYADYVRKGSEGLKRKTTLVIDPIIILLALIIIASVILAFLLFKKEKPKAAQMLEKAQ